MAVLNDLFPSWAIPVLLVVGILGLLVRFATPKLDAREPPMLYPRIPFIGHILGMLWHHIDYFPRIVSSRTPPAFTLPLANGKLYILTEPYIVQAGLRNKNLDFQPIIEDFAQKMLDISDRANTIMRGPKNEKGESYMGDIHNAMHQALVPGKGLLQMNKVVLDKIGSDINTVGNEWQTENLYLWVRDIFTIASSRALYGPHDIVSADHSLIEHLWNFDEDQLRLVSMPYPSLFARKAYIARELFTARFLEWYKKGYVTESSPFITLRYEVATRWDQDLETIARFEMLMLFVTATNAMPSFFWMFVYILDNPALFAEIRAEMMAITTFKKTIDADGREQTEGVINISGFANDCPLLNSAYRETQRLRNAPVSNRIVLADTTLTSADGTQYLLKKGNTCQSPSNLLHESTRVWGADASSFDGRRFLRRDTPAEKGGVSKETKKLQTQGYLPFGGGKHLCPGRFFALAEIFGTIAMMVLGFEVESVDGGRVGVPKAARQKFGVAVKKPATEPRVRMRRRPDMAGVKWSFLVGDDDAMPNEI